GLDCLGRRRDRRVVGDIQPDEPGAQPLGGCPAALGVAGPDVDGVTRGDQLILEAGFREFAEYGVAGARVDRIAKSAACNKNLIYVYFGSKEALFASVLDRHLSEAYVGLPFTPEDLPGYARRVFDFAQANPGIYRLLAWATLERGAA